MISLILVLNFAKIALKWTFFDYFRSTSGSKTHKNISQEFYYYWLDCWGDCITRTYLNNCFYENESCFLEKNMTHDFRWVIIFWCCARIDLGLSVAKKIRVLSIKVCPSRRALWNLHFFWFFSKTVIFGNRNMLYDSYLFSTFYLLWKNWKKSGKKRNFEIDFSHYKI